MAEEKRFQIRDARSRQSFRVDDALVDDMAQVVGWKATLVYLVLVRHADRDQEAWPAMETIAAKVGISRESVNLGIRTLLSHNIILLLDKKRATAGRWGCNVYQLQDKSVWIKQPDHVSHADTVTPLDRVSQTDTVDVPTVSAPAASPCQPQPVHHVSQPDRKDTATVKDTQEKVAPDTPGACRLRAEPYTFRTDPLSRLVYAYKGLRVKLDNRAWDKEWWKRAAASAKRLLEHFQEFPTVVDREGKDVVAAAVRYIKTCAREHRDRGLDFTFETLVKAAPEWLEKKAAEISRAKERVTRQDLQQHQEQDASDSDDAFARDLSEIARLAQADQDRIRQAAEKALGKISNFIPEGVRKANLQLQMVEIYRKERAHAAE